MKKLQTLFMTVAIAFGLLQFAACVKPPIDFDPRSANVVLTQTRIEKIVQSFFPFTGDDTLTFTYNIANNPATVTPIESSIGTGNPAYVFHYDKKGKLTELIGFYRNTMRYEIWHKYVYKDDRIVIDTQRIFGVYPEETMVFNLTYIRYLKYDAFDRISVDSLVFLYNTDPAVTHYNYDNSGNLIRAGLVYDNKLNPHRTNKIWMFVDRNYSVNNPIPAAAYNSYGLPLLFNTPSKGFMSFLGHDFNQGSITYNHN